MKSVIFGAGNVGRGFLGLEMSSRNYEVSFVDVDQTLVDKLNSNGRYDVHFF